LFHSKASFTSKRTWWWLVRDGEASENLRDIYNSTTETQKALNYKREKGVDKAEG